MIKKIHNWINSLKQFSKEEVLLKKWEHIISLIALVVSVISIYTSWQTGKAVANYEFLLSQTPNIRILNQEIQIPFDVNFDIESTEFGGYRGIIDLKTTEDDDFPIKIPVYNIGVGIAQNCKVIWSAQNQKEVILQCREIFQDFGLEPYTEKSTHYDNAYSETYLKGFGIVLDDEEILEIEPFYAKTIGEHYVFLDDDYTCVFPYILPISEEKNVNYFEIPEEFSAFILESLHQEVIDMWRTDYQSIFIEFNIIYQDLNGKLYESNCELKFTPLNTGISVLEPMMQVQLEVTMK